MRTRRANLTDIQKCDFLSYLLLPQGCLESCRCLHLVLLHAHHGVLLYCQFRCEWIYLPRLFIHNWLASLPSSPAAFLTIESNVSPISSAEDLAALNGKIMYGAKRDGSTINFFREGEYPTYQKMWQYMSSHPDHLTSSNSEGVERVKTQNYAFLMESTSIEYQVERECDVTQVGRLLDDKGYGIAMRKSKFPFILPQCRITTQLIEISGRFRVSRSPI